MRNKREVVELLNYIFQVEEDLVEAGNFRAAQVASVQADTLEYVLGIPGTATEDFVQDARQIDADEDALADDEVEDAIAEALNRSIRVAFAGR